MYNDAGLQGIKLFLSEGEFESFVFYGIQSIIDLLNFFVNSIHIELKEFRAVIVKKNNSCTY